MNWRNYKIIEIDGWFYIRKGWIHHDWWSPVSRRWFCIKYEGFSSLAQARDAWSKIMGRSHTVEHPVQAHDMIEGEVIDRDYQTGSWK